MRLYGLAVILMLYFVLALTVLTRIKETKKQKLIIKQLNHKVDSLNEANIILKEELFPVSVELTRYRITLDILYDRNPKAAHEFIEIMSNETE